MCQHFEFAWQRNDVPDGLAGPSGTSARFLFGGNERLMNTALVDRIVDCVSEAAGLYHRLVLVVGPSQSGKTAGLREVCATKGWPIINLNLQLSERLLELTKRQRAISVPNLVDELLRSEEGDTLALDNIELLFDPDLAVDALRLLQGLSRDRTLVVAWPGSYDGSNLTYAEPGHPEARRYMQPDAIILATQQNSKGSKQESA